MGYSFPQIPDPTDPMLGGDWEESLSYVSPSQITADTMPTAARSLARISSPDMGGGTLLPEEPALPLGEFGEGNEAPYGTGRSATERMGQLPGSAVARDGAPWQTALGILNPLNLVGLPFRFLKTIDRGIKSSLGRRTMADQATGAARYIDDVYGRPIPGFEDGDQRQLPQDLDPVVQNYIRTKAGGQKPGESMNPLPTMSENFWNVLTGEGFETERATVDAARRLSGQSKAQAAMIKAEREAESYNIWKQREGFETAQEAEKAHQERFKTEMQPQSFDAWLRGEEADIGQSRASAASSYASAGLSGERAATERAMRPYQLDREERRAVRDERTMPYGEGPFAGQTPVQAYGNQARVGRDETVEKRAAERAARADAKARADAVGKASKAMDAETARALLGPYAEEYEIEDPGFMTRWRNSKAPVTLRQRRSSDPQHDDNQPSAAGAPGVLPRGTRVRQKGTTELFEVETPMALPDGYEVVQ